jgi:perosamine synthetase
MDYKIPQVEPCFSREERRNVNKVLKNKWLTEGKFAEEFIDLIKEKTGANYVALAPNGTLAIYLALLASGIKQGDWVIVPDFTFNATASPLSFIGAIPQFVDVESKTLNIDPAQVEEAIRWGEKKTKAIIPVHIFGQSADMSSIMDIAHKHKLKVIEDAAQAIGVNYWWKGSYHHVGTIGDVGIISFFADKTVTCGEGACLLTNDKKTYIKIKMLRNQGRLSSGVFKHDELGMNFRMTDLQCAVGVAQLKKITWIIKRKKEIGSQYAIRLLNSEENGYLEALTLKENINLTQSIVPFRFPLRIKNGKKKQVIKALEHAGVQTREFFYPLHKQPCWKHLCYDDDFENTMKAYEEGICLPIYPTLKESQVDYICNTIIEALA